MASFYQFLGGSAEQKQQQVFIRQMGGSGSIALAYSNRPLISMGFLVSQSFEELRRGSRPK